jgi:hypothetical protein
MKSLVIVASSVAAVLVTPVAAAHDHVDVPGIQIGATVALTVLTVAAFSVSRRSLRKLVARNSEGRR